MWEYKYGKEPLDTRLCFLRLVRKWWLLLLLIAAGAGIFGGIYFLKHMVYAPAREYTAEAEFYIDYKDAVTMEQQYTYYNKETWETLIHSDVFMDAAAKESSMDRAQVEQAVFATLLTDVRIVHVTVTTHSAEDTMKIVKGLERGFTAFGQSRLEIDEIQVLRMPQEATLTVLDNRTGRACILGAVVAGFVTLFGMYLYVVLDTSVYLPVELERSYGIPARVAMPEEEALTESMSVIIKKKGDGTPVLYIRSKDHNKQLAEKLLGEQKLSGEPVAEAVLTHADEGLIRWYYKAKFL